MLKAKEAKALTEKMIKEEIATRKKEATFFCENVIEPLIIAQCKNFIGSRIIIEIADKKIIPYVMDILKDCGYQVTRENNTQVISIDW